MISHFCLLGWGGVGVSLLAPLAYTVKYRSIDKHILLLDIHICGNFLPQI